MMELLLAAALIGQNPTVTIPVDPAQIEIQVPVDTTFVDSRGVRWELKGTLVARPAAPATQPPDNNGPVINSYLDLDGNWLHVAKPGQRFLVSGSGFGESGTVRYAHALLPVVSWLDSLIAADLPAVMVPTQRSAVTVRRADGAFYSGLAFEVQE